MPPPARDPDPSLVTGASGYVGGHLLAELLRRGRRVRTLTRNPDRASRREGVDVRAGDAISGRGLHEVGIRSADSAMHDDRKIREWKYQAAV